MYFKKIRNTALYQSNKKKNKYFEGWYYKLVSDDELFSLALIPGISKNKEDPHSFIQVFLNTNSTLKTYYIRFNSNEFIYSHEKFLVKIGENIFTKDQVIVNINTSELTLNLDLKLSNHHNIKQTRYAPNIMGPFAYIPFMECYHGILSMKSNISGDVYYNKTKTTLTNGVAYMEKDWGRSFPKEYIWLQSNHFSNINTSFMFSYAIIPFTIFKFKGLICNLIHEGVEYRFATYNNTKIKKKIIKLNEVEFTLKKGKHTLVIKALKTSDIALKSPSMGVMSQTIKEGLSGNVKLALYKSDGLVFEDVGTSAGIEIMMK